MLSFRLLRKLLFCYIFCLLVVLPVSAKLNHVVLDRLTVEDGLSQASILALAQDKSGYIWLGTENGINLFDGNRITSLSGPDDDFYKYSVSNINVVDDFVWLSLSGKGLYYYDLKANQYQMVVAYEANDESTHIWQVIGAEHKDYYWLLSQNAIFYYHLPSQTFEKKIDLTTQIGDETPIYHLRLLNKRLFLASRLGLYVYLPESEQLVKVPAVTQAQINNISVSNVEAAKVYDVLLHQQQYYVGTNDGVFSFTDENLASFLRQEKTSIKYEAAIANTSVWQLLVHNEQLFAATTRGLFRQDLISKKDEFLFDFGDVYNTVADPNITKLIADKNGRLWLASQSSGVYMWDPKTELVTTYTYKKDNADSLSNGNVTAVSVSDDKRLWLGSKNGLNQIDLESKQVSRFLVSPNIDTSFTQSNIYDIERDQHQRLWIVTAKGVVIFDEVSQEIIEPDFPKATKEILAVENSWLTIGFVHQYMWVVVEEGVYRIDTTSGKAQLLSDLPEDFNSNFIWSIMPSFSGSEDEVLISTSSTLWQYNTKSKQLKKIYTRPGIGKDAISHIDHWVKDQQGLIWFSYTQEGLIAIDPETYQEKYILNEKNSMLDANIYGVQIDKNGNLWVSTHNGIFRVRPQDQHVRRFSIQDGLSNAEFNSGVFASLADGSLIYGGVAGVSIFDPVALNAKHQNDVNQARIVGISTLSRALPNIPLVPKDYHVVLEHDDFGIRIDFSDFSYKQSRETVYQYGFLNEVSFPQTKQNYVTFPYLEAGEHVFSVRAQSTITGEYSAPSRLYIKVKYALWRSPEMIVLYIIILLASFFIWLRNRQRHQQALLAAHEQVKYRENRLQLALSGSNSEVWDWKRNKDLIYGKRITKDLGYHDLDLATEFQQHVALIHPDDRDSFINSWQRFLFIADADANFECSYRLKSFDGRWLWYRDLGKIVAFDAQGRPSRVTGSYTNITDSKIDQERAQYYGAAFAQTRDWVLILDDKLAHGRANKSMTKAFGWHKEEINLYEEHYGIKQEQINYYRELLPIVYEKGFWRGEEVIITPDGKQYHVITNISISINVEHQKTHFICVYTDISAQKVAENELRIMANYDHLTGLPNRTLLLDRVNHAISGANRTKLPVALFFIDLDRFKQVNDSMGHKYGDMLLQEVARRLSESLREDDTLARIGGDEFIVLLERFRGHNELGNIAQKFIDLIEKPYVIDGNIISIGASIGISLYPDDATGADAFFRNADLAMYHAKQLGRNNYQFFTEHMNIAAKERLMRESQLKLGLANNEFFNVYQPIVDAHTGKAVGVELLLRWRHKGQVIPPFEFIELAEELGLIATMTEQAIERGFKQLKIWRTIRSDFYMSVNFSATHFVDEQLYSSIEKQFKAHNMPANAMKIEVTESAFFTKPEQAIKTMNALSELGVMLSLDDFGTGFSSLSYLKRLPLDIIKIDRSFVSGIGVENTDEAIVDATLVLANSLNMYCIAEGVETKEQLQYLVNKGCHLIQGYLYFKPLAAEEITENLQKNYQELKVKCALDDLE